MTDMNNKDKLKPAIEEIVSEEMLTESEVDHLLELQEQLLEKGTTSNTKEQHKSKSWYLMFSSVAASFLVVAVLIFNLNSTPDNTYEIALEGVKSHLTESPLQVETTSLDLIKSTLPELNFSPVVSSLYADYLIPSSTQLLGGKYCTIKGLIAAHFRFDGEQDNSLFQASYNEALHGDIPSPAQGDEIVTHLIKGLEVSIWQEKGLLMMLVN